MFKGQMLSKIFGSKREEVRVDSRKLHNEELLNLSSSEKYYSQVTEKEMVRHVTRMESKRNVRRFFIMKREGVYLEDPGVDGWLILKYILKEYNIKFYSRLNWL
jgi:hypothetical protein